MMVVAADGATALAGFLVATDFAEVAGFAAVLGVDGAADGVGAGVWDAGGGAVCANASVTQEDKKIEEMKCFIVRGCSGVILMGV